jgi:hypothetical protein
VTEPVPTQKNEIEQAGLTLIDQAKAIAIRTHEQYEAACRFVLEVKAHDKRVDEAFDPIVKAAHEAHRKALEQKKYYKRTGEEALCIVEPKLLAYRREQEDRRRGEEARLQREAQKRAEEEALRAAEEAERRGEHEEAQAIIEEPVKAPPVVLEDTTPKVAGISERAVWKARVVDEAKVPREYLMPDLKKLDRLAKAMKGAMTIAGVEFYEERSIVKRPP